MPLVFRAILVAALIVCLSNEPLRANADSALGVLLEAERARVGRAEATVGATIYSGDLLTTEPGGKLLVRVGTTQFSVSSDSAVRLYQRPNGAVAELQRGAVNYTTTGAGENIEIVSYDIRSVPKTSQPTFGQVAIVNRCVLRVTSQRGAVEVTSGQETRTVDEGTSFLVTADSSVVYRADGVTPDSPDYHATHEHVCCVPEIAKRLPPLLTTGSNHFVQTAMIAIGVATGIVVFRALLSPSSP